MSVNGTSNDGLARRSQYENSITNVTECLMPTDNDPFDLVKYWFISV